jgi:hypothetical protein
VIWVLYCGGAQRSNLDLKHWKNKQNPQNPRNPEPQIKQKTIQETIYWQEKRNRNTKTRYNETTREKTEQYAEEKAKSTHILSASQLVWDMVLIIWFLYIINISTNMILIINIERLKKKTKTKDFVAYLSLILQNTAH